MSAFDDGQGNGEPPAFSTWKPTSQAPPHANGQTDQTGQTGLTGLQITVPADPEHATQLRHTLQTWLEAHKVPEDLRVDITLAVNEAISNVVEHAYRDRPQGTVELSARRGVDHVVVQVADRGRWRPPPADPGTRGRGLPMIHAIATTVHIEPRIGGTTVTTYYPIPT